MPSEPDKPVRPEKIALATVKPTTPTKPVIKPPVVKPPKKL